MIDVKEFVKQKFNIERELYLHNKVDDMDYVDLIQLLNDFQQQLLNKHNVMRRVAIVECCWQCPHHIHDDGNDEAKWGKHWCNKLDIEIVDADTIPNGCPLPFA